MQKRSKDRLTKVNLLLETVHLSTFTHSKPAIMLLELFGLKSLSNLQFHKASLLVIIFVMPIFLWSVPVICTFPAWLVFWYRSKCYGLRRIGDSENHKDEAKSDGTVAHAACNGSTAMGTTHSLVIYPIKSCGYVKVSKAPVVEEGLLFDRVFSFAQKVSVPNETENKISAPWKFITQRNLANMANIKVEIWLPCAYEHASQRTKGLLLLKFPSATRKRPPWLARIPLAPSIKQSVDKEDSLEPVNIWRDTPRALKVVSTESLNPPSWIVALRQYLGVAEDLGLFYLPQDHLRKVYRNAPRQDEHGWQPKVGFGDSYPIHIVNLSSVRHLEHHINENDKKRVASKHPASRQAFDLTLNFLQFRPNIIVQGYEAYAEDHWKRIRIGHSEFVVTNRTARCPLPNVNQDTGERHSREPLTTMTKSRCIDEGAAGTPCFGMMMVPVSQRSVIEVGSRVEALETGEHLYVRM